MGLLDTLITAGATVAAGAMQSSANNSAATTSAQSQLAAADKQIKRTEEAMKIANKDYKKAGDVRAAGFKGAANDRIAGIEQAGATSVQHQLSARDALLAYEREAARIGEAGMRKAAELSAQGFEKEAAELRAGLAQQIAGFDAKIAAIKSGAADAQEALSGIMGQNEGGQTLLRETVGRGSALDEHQRRQLEEARRVMGNSLRGSSFDGSGRTAASMLRKVEGDNVSAMMQKNKADALAAANVMAGYYNNAANRSAEVDFTTGQLVGGAEADKGTAAATNSALVGKSMLGAANARAQGELGGSEIAATSQRTQGAATAATDLGIGKTLADQYTAVGNERGQATGGAAGAKADAIDKTATVKVNATQGMGVVEGTALRNSGETAANAEVANGKIYSQVTGDLGGMLAQETKKANTAAA